MKKIYFNFLIPIVCPFFTFANETLPVDTKRQIFIYETIRDYKPRSHDSAETAVLNSCLSESEKQDLILTLDKQCKLLCEINSNLLFPLLHRSIPTKYILSEIKDLEKNGKIEPGVNEFISRAIEAGFSLDGALDYIREQIKKDIENKKSKL